MRKLLLYSCYTTGFHEVSQKGYVYESGRPVLQCLPLPPTPEAISWP